MTLTAIDVYHGNPAATVAAAMAQVDGLIAKASEAQSKDSAHDTYIAAARAAGKLIGHYHFGWFGMDPVAQAKFFVQAANPQPGDTLWLDVEREQNAPAAQWPALASERLAFTLTFSDTVSALTGAKCGHYCNRSDWAALLGAASTAAKAHLLSLPLWIADPSSPDGHPAISQPWFMQQTGIVNNIDRDLVNGDAAAWHAIGVGADMALSTDDINAVSAAAAHAVWNTVYPDIVAPGAPASTASLLLRIRKDANTAATATPAAPVPPPAPVINVTLTPGDITNIANAVADLLSARLQA